MLAQETQMKPNPTEHTSAKPIIHSLSNYADLFEYLPVAVYICNVDGYITYYNKAAVTLWGRKPEIGIDRWCGAWKLYRTNGQLLESNLIRSALNGEIVTHTDEVIVQRPDGAKVKVKPYPTPIFDNNGIVIGAMNTLVNVSEVTSDDEKQAVLAAIVENSDDTIISKTLKGIITSWNNAAERLFGYTEEEAKGKHISLIIPHERLSEEDYIIGEITKGNRIDHFETIRKTKDGRLIPISVTISPVRNNKGEVIGASKIARDISDKRLAEEKQAVLAAIVNTSDDTIISKTLKGIITSWNNAAEKLFGYTEEEAKGKHISLLIPSDRLPEEEYIIGEIAKGNRVDHFETIRKTKDGRLIPISLSVSPVKNQKGEVIGASKIARDISAQKEAQETAKRYTESLEIINSMVKTVSEELELNKILQKVTDTTTELTGAQLGAFLYNIIDNKGEQHTLYTFTGAQKSAFKKIIAEDTAAFQHLLFTHGIQRINDAAHDEQCSQAWSAFNSLKEKLPLSFLSIPINSRSGQPIGGLFLGHSTPNWFTREHEDIVTAIISQATIGLDNAQLYEEIKALNEKKDEFIGLASHELKTPLTSITGYLQILDKTLTEERNKKFVSKTLQQVKKLSGLVSDLLDVSKIQAGKLQLAKEKFDLIRVLHDSIELIQYSNHTHHISINNTEQTIEIYGDPQRIEQVIINLLTNAIKYSPGANEVIVMVSRTATEIKIGVKDFGIGISDEQLKHIFSRFYRVEGLSPTISGLGIGLYIAHEIAERHGGKLLVESEPGKGSTFWLNLPVDSIE